MHVTKQGRKFEFKLEISNPGDGSIVLLSVGISRWGTIIFEDVAMQTLTKLIRPRELESVEFTLPLTSFPANTDLTEILAPEKLIDLVAVVTYQSGTQGLRRASAKLRARWVELPLGGLVEGAALLLPTMPT